MLEVVQIDSSINVGIVTNPLTVFIYSCDLLTLGYNNPRVRQHRPSVVHYYIEQYI